MGWADPTQYSFKNCAERTNPHGDHSGDGLDRRFVGVVVLVQAVNPDRISPRPSKTFL